MEIGRLLDRHSFHLRPCASQATIVVDSDSNPQCKGNEAINEDKLHVIDLNKIT